jgi:hypothetical protein
VGISSVLVNGQLVLEGDKLTDRRSGVAIMGQGFQNSNVVSESSATGAYRVAKVRHLVKDK